MNKKTRNSYPSFAKRYTKQPGLDLPETPFKKGDVVVYEDNEGKVEDIIIIDHLSYEPHGDIHYHTAVVFQYPCRELEAPACFEHSGKTDWRNWFVGDSIRKPTAKELKFLLDAIIQNLPTGEDICKEIQSNS